jgi:hypothetical protein
VEDGEGAVTIFPIRQGLSLTLRSASKVILSGEFPCSPIARRLLWVTIFAVLAAVMVIVRIMVRRQRL